jgi:hypothetical protein
MSKRMKKAGVFCVSCVVGGFVELVAVLAAVIMWVEFN